MTKRSCLLFIALCIVVWPGPVLGQGGTCGGRAALLERFADRFAEVPIARGLMQNGGVLEVLGSADGATWTLVLTLPNGSSCIIASGQYWHAAPSPDPGDAT